MYYNKKMQEQICVMSEKNQTCISGKWTYTGMFLLNLKQEWINMYQHLYLQYKLKPADWLQSWNFKEVEDSAFCTQVAVWRRK